MTAPYVKVDAVAALNGRPYQFLIDPDIDLAAADLPLFGTPDWIVPLDADGEPGNYAMTLQEQHDRVMAVIWQHREASNADR